MIEVFKTNVQEEWQCKIIIEKLLEHYPNSSINFDLEDCDKILRVHANEISNTKIISILNFHGYFCEALP
ncbi:hypothetical protein [Flavobacterium phragmitis]|uniref:Uncharacterized protein n=1 Tax=Flavobacterium phragmitis TaxID=739143 RepID=A0A1I1QN16_9FLAO|nr:hypothetical protein [Flavobacterium phragmitis]SFD20673.1 hypothetical protein SAMN05216297_105264 [Flavobacterium phragmitis]